MLDSEEKITELRALARKFEPAAMNGRTPEAEDIHKLACALIDVLCWIEEHDQRTRRARRLLPPSR